MQADTADRIDDSFSDTFTIRMGGYLIARNDTVLSATTPYLVGSKINLQDDVGMDGHRNSFHIDSHYHFNDLHKLEFSYYNIRNGSRKVIEKSF
ncbi:hypothetical protein [Psychromonas hadalis]|uniref:hypothetical protein n=1 Tax=Psychromonas hadalis TaxID=211669 RepID=UPI0003B6456A|nr:hypothetical protein [Psychromonas hadalis]